MPFLKTFAQNEKQTTLSQIWAAQSAEAVEYTDCFLAEG